MAGALGRSDSRSLQVPYVAVDQTERGAEDNIMGILESEKVDGEEGLAIALSYDAYDAVIASAFDGIRITLPSDDDGHRQFIRLHPLCILFFCIILFTIQLSCLSCLVMDMALDRVSTSSDLTWEGFDESPSLQMKLVMRTVMVAVLQMITLKELLGSMRPVCLVLNPISWFELQRPTTAGRGWVFQAWICAPICLVAQMMQFSIAYYVLTVSMSVIIVAEDTKDVVFNGLVVTFLADLDEYAWVAMSTVFHMDQRHFEDFAFKLREDVEVDHARAEAKNSCKLWLYRGKGGKASIVENIVVFFTLTFIYIRQLFMFLEAIHTGILPTARDACTLYRGLKDPYKYWQAAIALHVVDFFTLINYRAMLIERVEHEQMRDECFSDTYYSGPFDEAGTFIEWWPYQVFGGVFGILFTLVVPQLLLANFKKVLLFLQEGSEVHRRLQNQTIMLKHQLVDTMAANSNDSKENLV